MKAAILTLSDKGSRGERVDLSGPALASWLRERAVQIARTELIADEAGLISAKLAEWADGGEFDLILTTGGTGVSPRDVTPEATERVLDRVIPGFGEAMRAASLSKTPQAMISRAVSGVRKRTFDREPAGKSARSNRKSRGRLARDSSCPQKNPGRHGRLRQNHALICCGK